MTDESQRCACGELASPGLIWLRIDDDWAHVRCYRCLECREEWIDGEDVLEALREAREKREQND